jgi:hypothetical protein
MQYMSTQKPGNYWIFPDDLTMVQILIQYMVAEYAAL